jgi:hypothetical protein
MAGPVTFGEAEWRREGSSICWQVGQCFLNNLEVPDIFGVDIEEEEETTRRYSGRVVYAEEIDGARDEL